MTLDWVIELVVLEGHVSYTVVLVVRRNRADRHAKAKPDIAVAHYNIFRALSIPGLLA